MNCTSRWSDRVAIVTGASAGIGAAICRSLVVLGMKVVGVARRQDRIQALAEKLSGAPGSLTAIQCDLSKDDQVEDMFKQVIDKFGAVHLLVNNAGYSTNHTLIDGNTAAWRGMLDVNIVALCYVTKLVVENMKANNIDDGHIINLSSVLGHFVSPFPDTHFYSATKHMVRTITEGLRQEIRAANSHIRVSCVSPGRCRTEFLVRMFGDQNVSDKIYSSGQNLSAEDVAQCVVLIISAPPHVEINDIIVRPTEQQI